MRNLIIISFSFFLVTHFTTSCFGQDIVKSKKGTELEGEVFAINDDGIEFNIQRSSASAILKIPFEQIEYFIIGNTQYTYNEGHLVKKNLPFKYEAEYQFADSISRQYSGFYLLKGGELLPTDSIVFNNNTFSRQVVQINGQYIDYNEISFLKTKGEFYVNPIPNTVGKITLAKRTVNGRVNIYQSSKSHVPFDSYGNFNTNTRVKMFMNTGFRPLMKLNINNVASVTKGCYESNKYLQKHNGAAFGHALATTIGLSFEVVGLFVLLFADVNDQYLAVPLGFCVAGVLTMRLSLNLRSIKQRHLISAINAFNESFE